MGKKLNLVGKKKSDISSSFAVFETFHDWGTIRNIKVLPDRAYFAVLTLLDKTKVDIIPDLFVQGYRPHSSSKKFSLDCRRYGQFVKNVRPQYADDIVFVDVQLYQVLDGLNVELILTAEETFSHDKVAIKQLTERICKERNYKVLSDGIEKMIYHCPVSSGYFLSSRSYQVWALPVAVQSEFELKKKILILDYNTGIPAVVYYDEAYFENL